MEIIELMTAIMGVVMGFLAFLLLGSLSGFFAWRFYPKTRAGTRGFKKRPQKLLIVILLGFIVALISSYIGQFAGIFQSGDMLEWFTAIFSACFVSCTYCALTQ
jgi:NhaP-type Na+/H+ or K+/H+ antiporter|uniref:hypothetical protein n=1 Tax=Polynucleobacter sp. TaxID=2029855 RepID=UPI004047B212